MSVLTQNLNLIKPELTDIADITMMNQNWDTIDSSIKELTDSLNDSLDADSNASDVLYDNTNSNLKSSNVQDALNETDSKIETLSAKAVTTNQIGLTITVDSSGILNITY